MKLGIYIIRPATSHLVRERFEAERLQSIVVDAAGAQTKEEWAFLLSEKLDFPTKSKSLDSAPDWLGDLQWLGADQGLALTVRGLDRCQERDQEILVHLLASAWDRHRSAGRRFIVVLESDEPERFQRHLARANTKLGSASKMAGVADVQRVPVILWAD